MPYTPNTPAPNTVANQTRKPIADNFVALAPWGFGYGQFLLQSAAPAFAAGVDGMYVLNNNALTSTNKNELFIHKQSNDAPTDIPFTASKMSDSTMVNCVSGWAYLPNGMLMKWGIFPVVANGLSVAIQVDVISGGPAFNKSFQVFLTPVVQPTNPGNFTAILSGGPAATTGRFQIIATNAINIPLSTQVSYIVIGV